MKHRILKKLVLLCTLAGIFGILTTAGAQESALPSAKSFELNVNHSVEGVLPRGVSFEGISLEGKTLKDAKSQIQEYADARVNRFICLAVMGHIYEFRGNDLGVAWTNPEIVSQLDGLIMSGNFIDQYKLQKDIDKNPVNLDLSFSLDETFVVNTISAYVDTYTVEPKNSGVGRGSDGSFIVTDSIDGVRFNKQQITQEVLAGLKDFSTADDYRYDFPFEEAPAQYTREDFNFSSTPLGSFTTYGLGRENRRQNVINAANKMNGHFFYPGETISTLSMYGDMTLENGYTYAPGYEMGKQVDTIGGGICQTTTTLYNAVLRAELGIGYRRNHSMIVRYVPAAMDATVAPPNSDFTFVNTTDHPIYIESYGSGDSVTVVIWGVETRPANRTIDFRTEILELIWPSVLYNQVIDDTNLVYGGANVAYKHRTEVDPHPSIKAKSYKRVYIDGVLQSEELLNYDVYQPMPGLLYHTSDCIVETTVQPSNDPNAVYGNIGWGVGIIVKTLSGENWPYYAP